MAKNRELKQLNKMQTDLQLYLMKSVGRFLIVLLIHRLTDSKEKYLL